MIYAKLKAWKEKSNLTYKDIAERSDVPTATVQKIFSGETTNPNSETLYKICKSLGHTMEELYEDTTKEKTEEIMAVSVIREMYEHRIAELKINNENHVNDLKESFAKHQQTYKTIVIVLGCIVTILFVLFLVYFAMDYANEHWGIFFRE